MRLLMTTDTVGGVWTFTSELSQELLRRGHAVHLVSFGRKPSIDQQAWAARQCAVSTDLDPHSAQRSPIGRHPERREEPLYSDRSGPTVMGKQPPHQSFLYTPSEAPLEWMQDNERAFEDGQQLLLEQIELFRPDLILASQFCFGALDTSAPRIVVAHSDVLSWAKACKPSALEPTPWLNRYTALVQRGLRRANAIIAPSRWLLHAVAANFSLPADQTVIPNGVRVHQVRDAVPTVPRRLQAISAGRLWDEAKGLDVLSEADIPCPVLVAGDETSTEGDAIKKPPVNATLLGPLPAARLHQIFRESAMYLCTSRYEPFGLAPLEAALCGCAVIARDLPSLREVWGEDALYFDDAASLTAQVRQLLSDPAALTDAQTRARARAQHYTVERMADAYLTVFQSVLENHKAMPYVA